MSTSISDFFFFSKFFWVIFLFLYLVLQLFKLWLICLAVWFWGVKKYEFVPIWLIYPWNLASNFLCVIKFNQITCPKTSLGFNHRWSSWLVFPMPGPEFEFTIFFTTIWVTRSNALAWNCTSILYLSTVPSPFYCLPPILPVLSPPPSPTCTIPGPPTTNPPRKFSKPT